MSKSKNSKPLEFEKGKIRELKKIIRQKDQQIRAMEKELGWSQNKSSKLDRKVKEPDLDTCPTCGKGFIKTSDIGIRKITTCSLYPDCSYRKVSK